ncbi:Flagellin-like hook-associated protein FlgL [uncultured Gammaproteobacteria bacterium]
MAISDVTLTAGMRSNLMLLQGTQSKMAEVQNKLATGNKINSALDGPTSYFAAKGLNQRAGDLSSLKDAMGQAVSTIKAGDKGITAIQSLVAQAKGLTESAYGALGTDAASTATRKTLADQFNKIKDQIDKMADDSGYNGKNLLVGNGMRLNSTSNSRGAVNSITGVSNARVTNMVSTDTYTVRVSGNSAVSADSNDVANAEDARGVFALKVSGTSSTTLGSFADISIETRGNTGKLRSFTVSDGNEAKTVKFFDNTQSATAATSTASKSGVSQVSTVAISGTIEAGDTFNVKVAGATFEYKATSSDTTATIASKLQASIAGGVTSGKIAAADVAAAGSVTVSGSTITITGASVATGAHDVAISASATNAATLHVSQSFASGSVVSFTIDRAAVEAATNGGNGVSTIQKNVNIDITATNLSGQTVSRSGTNQRGQGKLSNGENDFAFDTGTVRMTVDQGTIRKAATAAASKSLVTTQQTDANTSNDITVNFNENRTNNISVMSQDVKSDGQGLRLDSAQNGWTDRADIDKAVSSIDFATNKLRGASQTLSTSLNIVTTRENFTKEFSDVLTEGAGKLTLADQNEEGATLLMLQTRQQLGVTSLSMANQSQQSILKLF